LEGLGVYKDLLGNRPLVRLLVGEFISGIGDWLYIVAIFVVIYRETGNAALVGAFGAVRLVPYIALSVPAGIVADRFDRRMVLLVSDLYRGGLMAIMAVLVGTGGSTLLIAALAILAACGSAFFYPAMGAYLPALARDERQLGPANSAWATIQNFSFIVGPAIGGLVLVVGSVQTAFILNALSFIVIAVILWGLPPSRAGQPAAGSATEAPAGDDQAAAPSPTASTPSEPVLSPPPVAVSAPAPTPTTLAIRPLAGLTVVQLIAGFVGGGLQVITVILAIDVLKAGEEANGYLNAAVGVGGLIGGIGAGALVLRRALGLPLNVGAVITAAGAVALGTATSLPVALVAIGILSAGTLVVDVVGTTIFQRLVPDELRGRGTGVLMTITTVTAAVGAIAIPVALHELGPFPSLAATAVAMIVVTLIGTLMIGTAADRAPTPYEATIDRLKVLPLFAGVPRARIADAVRAATETPVTAGTVVIRQGDPADRFYIIASGTYTVSERPSTGTEPIVLRQLGPDQVFGELGLLYRTVRTATVTADVDGLLLALERDDFLALVGASGPLRNRLLGLYAAGPLGR
jgi:MFS family permease